MRPRLVGILVLTLAILLVLGLMAFAVLLQGNCGPSEGTSCTLDTAWWALLALGLSLAVLGLMLVTGRW